MIRRVLFAVAGFVGVCFSISAQETQRPEQIQPISFTLDQLIPSAVGDVRSDFGQTDTFSTLKNAYYAPASLTLADRRLFSFPSSLAWMEATPADFLPAFRAEKPPGVIRSVTAGRDAGNKLADLMPKFDYASGEVGIFYGKSSGKFGREVKQGYILGEVTDGNTHISVGAAYEESSGHLSHAGR